jgi:hypothetical protein
MRVHNVSDADRSRQAGSLGVYRRLCHPLNDTYEGLEAGCVRDRRKRRQSAVE